MLWMCEQQKKGILFFLSARRPHKTQRRFHSPWRSTILQKQAWGGHSIQQAQQCHLAHYKAPHSCEV